MRSLTRASVLLAMAAVGVWAAAPGSGPSETDKGDLSDAQIQDIIAKFAAKEAQFARARENYTYR